MRLPLLLALLLSLPVLPAAAQHGGGHPTGAASFHGARHGHAFHFRPSPFAFRGPFANYFPGYWGWGWGWDGDWAWDGVGAATMPTALPPPPHFAANDRPSVETTKQGVTIIRGPGSRHVPP